MMILLQYNMSPTFMCDPEQLYVPVSSPIRNREVIFLSVEYINLVNSAVYWQRLLFYDLISCGNKLSYRSYWSIVVTLNNQ